MSTSGSSRREPASEERVDVRRYHDALRRSRWLIASIVLGLTAVVVIVSLALPKVYTATTRLVLEETESVFSENNAESTRRRLVTIETLLTARQVLDAVAEEVGESEDSLEGKVTSEVDEEANIVSISAEADDPDKAARIANAVAAAFLDERTRLERDRLERARANLEEEITRLEGTPNADVQIGAIRERISELTVSEGGAGSDLLVAERAEPPSAATSPRPVRNGVLALFGGLFLGVLIALGRDQLTPRVSGPRELGRLLDLPVLVGVPYVRKQVLGKRMRMLSGVEAEAYQTLRAALDLALPADEKHVILVTGAVHAEGKTTATARTGRALAEGGHNTLIVSADLRVPRLHEVFDLKPGIGLADILTKLEHDGGGFDVGILREAIHPRQQQTYKQRGHRDHEPGDGPGDADIEERDLARDARSQPDERAQGSRERQRRRQKVRPRRIHVVAEAHDVMPHLVTTKNRENRQAVPESMDPEERIGETATQLIERLLECQHRR